MPDALLPKLDVLDREVLADPYPTYARLRAAGPLVRGGPGQWVATRYADVAALLRDPRLGSEFPDAYHEYSVGRGPSAEFLRRIILTRDPPQHGRLRRLMATALGGPAVRRLADVIAAAVDDLLEPGLEAGALDVAADLAVPLPVRVACELVGVPEADRDEVWPRAAALGKALGTVRPSAAEVAEADAAVGWLRDYVRDGGRIPPGWDPGEVLERDDLVDNTIFLLFAGFETTMGLISSGVAALLVHPGELERLRADPSLVPAAVDEFARYDAPVQWVARLVREPVALGERTVRPGRALVLVLGSANRDERRFADPDRFDVGRAPNEHLAYSSGIHQCLGERLARLEGRILLERLLARCSRLEPAGEPVRRHHPSIRSYAHLPVSLRAA